MLAPRRLTGSDPSSSTEQDEISGGKNLEFEEAGQNLLDRIKKLRQKLVAAPSLEVITPEEQCKQFA